MVSAGRTVGILAVANRRTGYRPEELEMLMALAPAIVEALHRKRTELALVRSEKLASVGRLASTIAHEINNPLAGATNALYLIAQDPGLSARTAEFVRVADRELRRAADIGRRILGFYRESRAPVPVRVCDVVSELLVSYEPRMRTSGISLQVRQRDKNATAIAGSGEIRQLLSNLLSNSIEAIGQNGTIHIRIQRLSLNTPAVRVTVADTGSGIDPKNMRRLFEPFFTTKKEIGTGLGLWICHEIVRQHGGRIRVRSCLGRGTVFCILLPATAPLPEKSDAAEA